MFIDEYLVDLDATRAAKAVGYSERSALAIGCENLRKPHIKAAIAARIKERAATLDVSAQAVVAELAKIAFGPGDITTHKVKSLELLGKHLAIFQEKDINVNVPVTVIVRQFAAVKNGE
jgi:phage terminase small subunit